jgi:pentatricopeptide repeat protein
MLADEQVKICKIFWHAIEKEGKLSPESFEALLKCYTECEYTEYNPVESVVKFATALLSKPVAGRVLKPSEKSYYYIVLSCCQAGDLKNAVKVLDLIKSQGVLVNEDYFHALMLGNCRAK